MSNLPSEIMVDILSRLPTKSIVRFRCLSKTWKTLFHDHSFIRAHLHHSINHTDPSLFIMFRDSISKRKVYSILSAKEPANSDRDVRNRNFPPFSPYSGTLYDLNFVGSCNGLICLASSYTNSQDAVHIWNPSLHEYFTLPPFHIQSRESYEIICYGFGFDATTVDYKVVKLVFNFITEVWYEIEVYSFTKGYWETISQVVPLHLHGLRHGEGVTLNRSIHWLGFDNEAKDMIVLFDLACETFGEMSLPNCSSAHTMGLCLLKGHLVWFSYQSYDFCELWVMKDYGVHRSWVKEHVIEFDTVRRSIERPLGFSGTGELLLECGGGRLISYDPETKQVKDFGIIVAGNTSCSVTYYVDSLLSCSGAKPS